MFLIIVKYPGNPRVLENKTAYFKIIQEKKTKS